MSEFINAVVQKLGDKRKYSTLNPIASNLSVKTKVELNSIHMLYEYYMFTSWSQKIFCSEKDAPQAMNLFIKDLKHAIYGDFYDRLRDLEFAVYEQDYHKIKRTLRELQEEVN